MKIKVYENKWHDILFEKLNINFTIFKKADIKFYNNFYEEFFKLYNDFDEFLKNIS